MKIAYLMNTYPLISTTFIRREIEAHERSGLSIERFSIRPWDQPVVDPRDIEEQKRVFYLLSKGVLPLFWMFLLEALQNPRGVIRALCATFQMIRNARGNKAKTFAYFLESVRLKREAILRGIDHIHTHFSTNSAAVAMLSYLMGGPVYSVTIHGPDELYEMNENSLTLKVKHAAFIAAITEYCRNVVDTHTKNQFTTKIKVVPCGLDMSEFNEISDVPDNKTLVCVGRLCKAKAQPLLIDAISKIVARHQDMRLVLVGDGELREQVEEKIDRYNLHDQVEILGWKSNADVREALIQARALVLPSLAEGLPIVIMESFSLGRPVLSTRINGIPELVDSSCGWLAEPGDQSTLVDSLDALLSSSPEVLTKMGKIGRERIIDRHDQDKSAALLQILFAEKIV